MSDTKAHFSGKGMTSPEKHNIEKKLACPTCRRDFTNKRPRGHYGECAECELAQ